MGLIFKTPEPFVSLDRPGKICRYLGINLSHNKIDLNERNFIQLYDIGFNPMFLSTPRIGITKNTDKLWRFCMAEDPLNYSYRSNLHK